MAPAPLTPAVFHILLALADGPKHGYAIMQAVELTGGPGLPTGPGTIYGSLLRMEEAGLVEERPAPPGERRRIFALQPAGRRALEAEAGGITHLAGLRTHQTSRDRGRLVTCEGNAGSRRFIAWRSTSIPGAFDARFAAISKPTPDNVARASVVWPAHPSGSFTTCCIGARDAAARAAGTARARTHRSVRETLMTSLWFDIRHAVRALLKAPVFTAVTIVTLALGIGANSATFSLVNAALLRRLEFKDPERLVLVYEGIPPSGVVRIRRIVSLIISTSSSTRICSRQSGRGTCTLTVELSEGAEGGTDRLRPRSRCRRRQALFAASEGRTFVPEEDLKQQSQRRDAHSATRSGRCALAAVRHSVGRFSLSISKPYTVVGVMLAGFEFPVLRRIIERDLRGRLASVDAFTRRSKNRARGMRYTHSVIGRLRDADVAAAQAAAEIWAPATHIRENYPGGLGDALQVTIGTGRC